MQVISLLLFALGTFAIPQPLPYELVPSWEQHNETNTTSTAEPNTLDKRAHKGWISSFDNPKCKGTHIGSHPKLYGSQQLSDNRCTPFKSVSQYIDIFWGSGGLSAGNNLTLYTDPACKDVWRVMKRDKSDEHLCFTLDGGVVIQSVQIPDKAKS